MFRLTSTAIALCVLAGHAAAQDLQFAPGEDARFSWDSFESFAETSDLSGETLEVLGQWTGSDTELISSVMAYFAAATGVDARYSGTGNFEQDVVVSLNAGLPPGLAAIAKPGLAADLASRGFLTPLGDETTDWVRSNCSAGESWVDLATFTGPDGSEDLYGLFYKVDVKSLVWFVPEQFEQAVYAVPETLEDLRALTEQIAADGGTPWCLGLGSGDATGWPATGWVEDLMLRINTPAEYVAWASCLTSAPLGQI